MHGDPADPTSNWSGAWEGGKEVWVRSKARPVSGPEKGKEVEGIFPGITRQDSPGVIDIQFAGGFTAIFEPENVFWSGSEALAAGSASGLRVRCIFSLCRTDGWGRWEVSNSFDPDLSALISPASALSPQPSALSPQPP